MSATEKRQVRDGLTLLIGGPAAFWAMRDPHCGRALAEQTDAIVKSFSELIYRNPAWVALFTASDAPWLTLLGLGTALAPVARAVYSHHIRHEEPQTEEGGSHGVDLSAYAAPVFQG